MSVLNADVIRGGGAIAVCNRAPGAIHFDVANTVFDSNDAGTGGGGGLLLHGQVAGPARFCTFYANCASSAGGGGALRAEPDGDHREPAAIVANTLFWRNATGCDTDRPSTQAPGDTVSPDPYVGVPAQRAVRLVNSFVHPTTGDINPNPSFRFDPVDPRSVHADLRLAQQSHAIDRGTDDAAIVRHLPHDLDGNGRQTQGRSTTLRGAVGAPWALSDFGAYEFCLAETDLALPGAVVISEVTLQSTITPLRTIETNWGNLAADAALWSAQTTYAADAGEPPADAAFLAAGELATAVDLVPGPLSPFTLRGSGTMAAEVHRLVVLSLTVDKLRDVLEVGVAGTEQGRLFLQVSGLYVEYDLAQAGAVTDRAYPCSSLLPTNTGRRIRTIRLRTSLPFRPLAQGPPLVDEVLFENGVRVVPATRTVRIVCSEFVADNLYTLCPAQDPRRTLCVTVSQAMSDYVQTYLAGVISQPSGYRQTQTSLLNSRLVAL